MTRKDVNGTLEIAPIYKKKCVMSQDWKSEVGAKESYKDNLHEGKGPKGGKKGDGVIIWCKQRERREIERQ